MIGLARTFVQANFDGVLADLIVQQVLAAAVQVPLIGLDFLLHEVELVEEVGINLLHVELALALCSGAFFRERRWSSFALLVPVLIHINYYYYAD